jgi:hypothetical protein
VRWPRRLFFAQESSLSSSLPVPVAGPSPTAAGPRATWTQHQTAVRIRASFVCERPRQHGSRLQLPALLFQSRSVWAAGTTRSHLPFPIEHQKQPGLHFEPSASPSGCHGGVDHQQRNNSKGKHQACLCVLGTPCKYSTHRATLMVMGMAAPRPLLCDLTSYRCHRPSYYAGAWVDKAPKEGGGGRTLHTRHARRLCMLVHLYISALLPIASSCVFVSPPQVSSPSTVGFFSPQKQL